MNEEEQNQSSTIGKGLAQSQDKIILTSDQLDLIAYWKNQSQNEHIPMWSTNLILDLPALAPNLMVLRFGNEPGLEILFHGSNSVERIGQDFTGKDYFQTNRAADADAIMPIARAIHSVPCGSLTQYRILQRRLNDFYYTITTLALPFRAPNAVDGQAIIQNFMTVTEEDNENLAAPSPQNRTDHTGARSFVDLGYGLPDSLTARFHAIQVHDANLL